jgi:predicted nucleic acid-binding protein
MLVVTDTTPINYLILVGQVDILAALYEQVLTCSLP